MATSIRRHTRNTQKARDSGERNAGPHLAISGPFAPVGAVVGGLVGGVVGGLIGHYAGEKVGDGANSVIDSHMDNG